MIHNYMHRAINRRNSSDSNATEHVMLCTATKMLVRVLMTSCHKCGFGDKEKIVSIAREDCDNFLVFLQGLRESMASTDEPIIVTEMISS